MAMTPDETEEPRTTPLDALHRELGGRMVAFAGYMLPVHYDYPSPWRERCRGGIIAEHLHCREHVALFDVSHMGQARLSGVGVAAAFGVPLAAAVKLAVCPIATVRLVGCLEIMGATLAVA